MFHPWVRSGLARPGGLLSALLLLLGGTSCSFTNGDRKPVFPVRGQVFVQNRPAVGAFVLFIPVNEPADSKDPRPRAYVDKDGSFTLSTYGANDGAPAGDYIVTVTWPEGESEDMLQGRYSDPAKKKLRATVKEEPTELAAYRLQ